MWNATRIRRALVPGALLALAVSPAALAQDNATPAAPPSPSTWATSSTPAGPSSRGSRAACGRCTWTARLWAIFFGNGASLGRSDFLYFTAGPNGEADGIFGSVNWVNTPNPDPAP
jgi:hypothetical protein